MSVIETPPQERLPIRTYIREYDDDAGPRGDPARDRSRRPGLLRPQPRQGHPDAGASGCGELVPEAKFGVGHGQMAEDQLEQVMLDFASGEINVLVCTTIIENGLDIPNANTIIVNNAALLRPGAALPVARARRARHASGLRLLPLQQGPQADAGRRAAAARDLRGDRAGRGLPHRHAGPGDTRRGQHPRRGAVRLRQLGRLRPLHAPAGRRHRRDAGQARGAARRAEAVVRDHRAAGWRLHPRRVHQRPHAQDSASTSGWRTWSSRSRSRRWWRR